MKDLAQYKIIGKRNDKIIVQTSGAGVIPSMVRIASEETKTVSKEYQSKHVQLAHQWNDDDKKTSLDEIMQYKGW